MSSPASRFRRRQEEHEELAGRWRSGTKICDLYAGQSIGLRVARGTERSAAAYLSDWLVGSGWEVVAGSGITSTTIPLVSLRSTELSIAYSRFEVSVMRPKALADETGQVLDDVRVSFAVSLENQIGIYRGGPPQVRLQLSKALEDLDEVYQRLVDTVAENGRLRGLLQANGIDPDLPGNALAVYRHSRGSNRRKLLVPAIMVLGAIGSAIGGLAGADQLLADDPKVATVVAEANAHCVVVQNVIVQMPAGVFDNDDDPYSG